MGHVCVRVYYGRIVITASKSYSELHQLVLIILPLKKNYIIVYMYLFVLFTLRENLTILLEDVNDQKKRLKEEGVLVDGKHFSVEFVGKIDISVTSVCLYPILN